MVYKSDDSNLATLIAAAQPDTKDLVALLVNRYSGGAVEFDGDCYIDMNSPGKLKDGMVVEFTGRPSNELRDWANS